ncbi:hypothetical protein OUZ56_022560 [Daphnia magna]|uniref:Uncharacterized protein n=1 Tax=Daphnia magna TaxID=35525 RepID=A0ABR0AWS6_9CRUS|nr:hypothetical protein OUZ56_022560 [Daphnia magna]
MAMVLNQLLVRPFHLQSLHNQFHCHVTNTASKGVHVSTNSFNGFKSWDILPEFFLFDLPLIPK